MVIVGSSVVCYFSYLDRYSIIQVKRLCKLIISMFISKVKLMKRSYGQTIINNDSQYKSINNEDNNPNKYSYPRFRNIAHFINLNVYVILRKLLTD